MTEARHRRVLDVDLLEEVADIARHLAEADDLDTLLHAIVATADRYLRDSAGVSLMLVRRGGQISSPAHSSPTARASDRAQYEANDGPCLEAIRRHRTIVVDDLHAETRWPGYRRRALELGIRSMTSFRLFLLDDTMGALNFYATRPHAFDARSHVLGQVFASHAAVALKAAIAETSLAAALHSRDVIGQAKGVLMATDQLTPDQAFHRLQQASQQQNRPLREMAEEVVRRGELP